VTPTGASSPTGYPAETESVKLQSSDFDCRFPHSISEHTHTSFTLHLGTSHEATSHFFKMVMKLELLLFAQQTMGKFAFTYPSILINSVSDTPTEGSPWRLHLLTCVYRSLFQLSIQTPSSLQ